MSEQVYFTGDEAFKAYGAQELEIQDHAIPRGRAVAYTGDRTFVGHDTNISVKSDYTWQDYDYFRPSQTIPVKKDDIISMCMTAYKKVGLVKNVIDLMGDFGAQGIRLQHPNPNVQQFYNTWWGKIQGPDRSERFLNTLYRCGNVIVKKSYGAVSSYQEKTWRKGTGKKDNEVSVDRIKTNARQIPLKYKFISPLSVEVVGDDLAQFVGAPALGLKISPKLRSAVKRAQQQKEMAPQVKKMLDKIPKDVMQAILRGDRVLPLDPDKINVFYYKKDDWELWADPMCYCILDDLLMLNQLKLADRSALDGAISNIRLWQLGIIGDSPATSILPTKTAINKLRNILANNVGGGTMDLVWGPELKFEESNSQVWRWLGSEKYDVTISAIYEGLGIPAPLRAKTSGSTNTSSYVGLNTLIKRLQYGRDKLVEFWNEELKYIHKAMGFMGPPPQVMFDFMALADEAAEKQLLINLWDREIISDDTILELFGRLPYVEKARVKYEYKERANERMPFKASPFHNPDKEHEYRKILLQAGEYAPSEMGIDLQDRDTNQQSDMEKKHEREKELMQLEMQHDAEIQDKQLEQKTQIDKEKLRMKNDIDKKRMQQEMTIKRQKVAQTGRPKNKTETTKRKPKPTSKPSTRAFIDIFMWANQAQEIISETITPALLYAYEKKDLRSLSKVEVGEIEKIKLNMLASIEPFENLTLERIYEALVMSTVNIDMDEMARMLHAHFSAQNGRPPTLKELHQIYASAYALYHE